MSKGDTYFSPDYAFECESSERLRFLFVCFSLRVDIGRLMGRSIRHKLMEETGLHEAANTVKSFEVCEFLTIQMKIQSEHSAAHVHPTGSVSSAMLGSPDLAGAISPEALLAIHTCLSLTAEGTRRETNLTCYVFRCSRSKRSKTKEKEVTFSRKLLLIMA